MELKRDNVIIWLKNDVYIIFNTKLKKILKRTKIDLNILSKPQRFKSEFAMFVVEARVFPQYWIFYMKVEFLDYIQIIKFNLLNSRDFKAVPIRYTIPSRYPQNIWINRDLKFLSIILRPMNLKNFREKETTIISLRNFELKEFTKFELDLDIFKIFLGEESPKILSFDVFCRDGSIQRLYFEKRKKHLVTKRKWYLGENLVSNFNYQERIKLDKLADNIYIGINNQFKFFKITLS